MTVDQLQKKLLDMICNEADLKALIIYDKDGIPVVQAHSSDCPSELLEPWLSYTFLISCEQISKLTGKCKYIITKYQSFSIVQCNRYPLFFTIVGNENVSQGYLMTIGEQLEESVEQIRKVLLEVKT